MPFLEVGGVPIRYREAGDGPPVLLLHGAGGSSAVWIGTLRRFSRTHRLVAPDFPGHGRSSGSIAGFEPLLQFVGAFAAAACLGPAVLVGLSLGSLLALAAAIRWPDRVTGLIAVAGSSRLRVSPHLLMRIDDWPGFHTYMIDVLHSPDTPLAVRRRSAAIAFSSSQSQTRADFLACTEHDATPQLGELRVPTVVVSGSDDLLIPAARGQKLAAAIGAPHLVIDRCGHMPMHEQPERFYTALANGLAAARH